MHNLAAPNVSGCDNYPGMPHYECNVDPLHPEDNLGIAFNSCVDYEVVGEVAIRCVLELAANGLPNVHTYLTFNVHEGTHCDPPPTLVATVSRDDLIAPDASIFVSGIEASHESDPSNGWPYDAIFALFTATNGLQP